MGKDVDQEKGPEANDTPSRSRNLAPYRHPARPFLEPIGSKSLDTFHPIGVF